MMNININISVTEKELTKIIYRSVEDTYVARRLVNYIVNDNKVYITLIDTEEDRIVEDILSDHEFVYAILHFCHIMNEGLELEDITKSGTNYIMNFSEPIYYECYK